MPHLDQLDLMNLAIKLLTWSASPLGLLCLGVIGGWLLRWFWPHRRWGVLLITLAVLQLLFFAMPPVASGLQAGLERRAIALTEANAGPPYDAILLLGGFSRSTRSPLEPGWQPDLTDAVDRATHAASLWFDGLAPRVVVAGGAWPSSPPKPPEALLMQQLLVQLGVPQNAIVLEARSTTTRENMRFVAQIVNDEGWQKQLALVTSASHMPRAYANANWAGLQVDAYPTDWQAEAVMDTPIGWLPNSDALELSARAIKEWIALMADY